MEGGQAGVRKVRNIHTCVHTLLYMHIHTCEPTDACIHMCLHTHTTACTHTCTYIHTCIHSTCTYTHTCVHKQHPTMSVTLGRQLWGETQLPSSRDLAGRNASFFGFVPFRKRVGPCASQCFQTNSVSGRAA